MIAEKNNSRDEARERERERGKGASILFSESRRKFARSWQLSRESVAGKVPAARSDILCRVRRSDDWECGWFVDKRSRRLPRRKKMPRAMHRSRGKTRVVHVSARSLDVNVVDAAERASERTSERASERLPRRRTFPRPPSVSAYPRLARTSPSYVNRAIFRITRDKRT